MSSESDQAIFEQAQEAADNTVLFEAKRWASIPDNSSNGGVFTSQFQFNLNTLSNLSQWNNLSEGLVTFPVRLQIIHKSGALTGDCQVDDMAACIKNGFHHFLDSVQVTVGGTTIQNAQVFENVNAQFKILSEWSADDYRKYGSALGLGLDDYQITLDNTTGAYADASYVGLDNVAIGTSVPVQGFTLPREANPGFKERALHLNTTSTSTATAATILGTNLGAVGKSKVKFTVNPAIGSNAFTMLSLATIRLKDISDAIKKLPPMKNLKGLLMFNYNAGSCDITFDNTGAVTAGKQATPMYGQTFPAMIGHFKAGTTAGVGVSTVWTFKADISGETTDGLSPVQTNARLHVPYYVASPTVDKALTVVKKVRYNERVVYTFDVDAGQAANPVITPGCVNPKRLILLPFLTSTSSVAALQNFSDVAAQSPWAHTPAGSTPFTAIRGFQVIVGGVPIFQAPVDMDWQTFLNEVALQGEDGGQIIGDASGLLSQRLWDQLYRFYTCDISRRTGSDDGANKAVQVQFTNATNARMHIIAFVLTEREIEVDTAMGMITQGV